MIDEFNFIILGALGWVLIAQYRAHGCLKRLEGMLKNHLSELIK